ncbi:hypothetical protein CEXT_342351 [Caerostris extrusa]|uniref:Uncharacterized protein n=1 Tax=Caerostris extrusa TaxID=172846 RepID=A0AAV4RWQ5_CAEEX|nr:hypothetical protein CEXT_342351 [Caerostris extrusa]
MLRFVMLVTRWRYIEVKVEVELHRFPNRQEWKSEDPGSNIVEVQVKFPGKNEPQRFRLDSAKEVSKKE